MFQPLDDKLVIELPQDFFDEEKEVVSEGGLILPGGPAKQEAPPLIYCVCRASGPDVKVVKPGNVCFITKFAPRWPCPGGDKFKVIISEREVLGIEVQDK